MPCICFGTGDEGVAQCDAPMNRHDDLDVLATQIQAHWRGKVARRKVDRMSHKNASLHRVVSVSSERPSLGDACMACIHDSVTCVCSCWSD